MKNIKINQLVLENFKGFRSLEANFSDGVTTVRGDNGTGKTTLQDAFLWCLFGKDHNGRTDFEIKTKENGTAVPRLDHSVTAALSVNGTAVTLKRCLVEKWVRPRGKADEEFQGNETKYYVNGVEIKATAYSARVAEIVDEQLFKMLTNPAHFPSLDWKTRREILVRISGAASMEDIAARDEDMKTILTQLSGKDLAAYRKELADRRKKIIAELDEQPVKVNAIMSVMPEAPDYATLDRRAAELESEIKAVDEDINKAGDVAKARYTERKEAFDRISELKLKQNEIIAEERQRRQLEYMEKNSEADLAKNSLASTEREYKSYVADVTVMLNDSDGYLSRLKAEAEARRKKVDELRRKWEERNAEEYKPSADGVTCPLSGAPCTDAAVLARHAQAEQEAREAFDRKKTEDLDRINAEGSKLKADIEAGDKAIAETTDAIVKAKAEHAEHEEAYKRKIEELRAKVASCPTVPIDTNVKGEDIEEWRKLDEEIKSMQARADAVEDGNADNAIPQLQEKRKALAAELDGVKQALSVRDVIAKNNKEIDRIHEREKELAQQKADVERMEYNAKRLNDTHISEVETKVNAMFSHVRFQMFEPQINGGTADACNILVGENGVKYGSGANNGGEVNAGLDIINTLCAFHGVTAPIFIDNAESVTQLLPVQSQVIRLVVDESKKKLEITME